VTPGKRGAEDEARDERRGAEVMRGKRHIQDRRNRVAIGIVIYQDVDK
jgi:hypothetical protein